MDDNWRYYARCLIARSFRFVPKRIPSFFYLLRNSILLARWEKPVRDNIQTEWWYCVKDTPLELESLKAKRRYEINKGRKNFDTKLIDPMTYRSELSKIFVHVAERYPAIYRSIPDNKEMDEKIALWSREKIVIGAFKDNTLCGYLIAAADGDMLHLEMVKVLDIYEPLNINFALLAFLCDWYLVNGFSMLNDGSRNIRHQTAFQDFLIKYFGFKKAYCHLFIKYHPFVWMLIILLYPFRYSLYQSKHRVWYNLGCLLRQEEFRRNSLEIL